LKLVFQKTVKFTDSIQIIV